MAIEQMTSIKEAIKKLAKSDFPCIMQGKVKEVDENKRTCIVTSLVSETDIPEVRLNAVIDDNQNYLVSYPKQNSLVWIAFSDDSLEAFVVAMSEVTKVEWRCPKIIFNKGDKKGMVILEKTVDRLNNIEKTLNKLLNDYTFHVHSDPLSGTTGTIVVPPTATSIIPTVNSDIENTDILQ